MDFVATEILCQDGDAAEGYRIAMTAIVDEIFRTMLGVAISKAPCESIVTREVVTAVVSLDGVAEGAVWLRCSLSQAQALARRLVGRTTGLREIEVDDMMRELMSIVAGNLGTLLPHGVTIGVPAVYRGRLGFVSETMFPRVLRVCFQFEGEVFSLNAGEREGNDTLGLLRHE